MWVESMVVQGHFKDDGFCLSKMETILFIFLQEALPDSGAFSVLPQPPGLQPWLHLLFSIVIALVSVCITHLMMNSIRTHKIALVIEDHCEDIDGNKEVKTYSHTVKLHRDHKNLRTGRLFRIQDSSRN